MRFLSQRGFTLIELIIVLVVIAGGILLYSAIWEDNEEAGKDEAEKKVSTPQQLAEQWHVHSPHGYFKLDKRKRWTAVFLFKIAECTHLGSKNEQTLMCRYDGGQKIFLPTSHYYRYSASSVKDSVKDKDIYIRLDRDRVIFFSPAIFTKDIFNLKYDVAHYDNRWLHNVGQHEPLFKAVKLFLEQYHDLAERLTILHEGRAKIIREYGGGSDVKALDSDIKKLSALGWQLTQVTKRFFVAIKPRMVKLEVAATRQQALAGLRTFENEIDAAQTTSSQSLDDIIANIDQAVRKLERAINQ